MSRKEARRFRELVRKARREKPFDNRPKSAREKDQREKGTEKKKPKVGTE